MAEFHDNIELSTVSMSQAGLEELCDNFDRACLILARHFDEGDGCTGEPIEDVVEWMNNASTALRELL